MKYKIIMLLSILFIISISTVSAEPINNLTSGGIDDSTNIDNQIILEDTDTKNNDGTFQELHDILYKTPEGSTITLNKNYSYDVSGNDRGISIYNDVTIDGNGHTLDGKNSIRIFYIGVNAKNVTLKNINFINAYSDGSGGAILDDGATLTIRNCTFLNNKIDGNTGGAIAINKANNVMISDCNFNENRANSIGGAISITGNNTIIYNNNFTKNEATLHLGGAIITLGNDNIVKNNIFIRNFAGRDGGALDMEGTESGTIGARNIVSDNIFIENNAPFGGAVGLNAINTTVSNNIFTKNEAITKKENGFWGLGGALRIMGEKNTISTTGKKYTKIINNTFTDNKAYKQGGAIYIEDTNSTISKNKFINNTAETDAGGSINIKAADATISNNEISLTNSYSGGGAIFCKGYNVKITGNTITAANSNNGGGAIYLLGISSIIDGNAISNSAAIEFGGAIFLNGEKAVIKNNKFNNNSVEKQGGAVYLESVGAKISNNQFTNNIANNRAGALIARNASITIEGNNFENNTATNTAGALLIDGNNVIVNSNNFTGNKLIVQEQGGGAIRWFGDKATVKFNTFEKNTAIIGFAIYGKGNNAQVTENTFIGSEQSDKTLVWGDMKFSGNKFTNDENKNNTDDKKIESIISTSTVNTVYNGGKYLVITLKDALGNTINNEKLNIILNTQTKNPSTDNNGQVKISTNNLAPKTYDVKISFKGNAKYESSSANTKVIVKKATPKLTARAKTFKKSMKNKKFTVTLKTNKNKVMKNTKVTLKVNGKTYTANTNSKGVATVKITKLTKKGKFTATIKYVGNKYYNTKTIKAKITIK